MAFFPTYKDNWTRTPNVFFDEVLTSKGVTANEIKLVGYLIRNTLGYNKEAKWIGASRSDLIKKANIPNGSITETITKCVSKGWILEYISDAANTQRYIFLNDERNQMIVEGLKKGAFKVDDLKYLNEAGLELLIEQYVKNKNVRSSTESVVPNNCSSTESVEGGSTESVGGRPTESVVPNKPSKQKNQRVSAPLNTSFKDNKYKDNKYILQSKLPRAIQKQMNGETTVEMSADDLIEKQRRIQAKLKLMNERLSKRKEEKTLP